jgi:hypothetical protein
VVPRSTKSSSLSLASRCQEYVRNLRIPSVARFPVRKREISPLDTPKEKKLEKAERISAGLFEVVTKLSSGDCRRAQLLSVTHSGFWDCAFRRRAYQA